MEEYSFYLKSIQNLMAQQIEIHHIQKISSDFDNFVKKIK